MIRRAGSESTIAPLTALALLCVAIAMPVAASAKRCRTTDQCAAESFCKKPWGRCGAKGRCVERPTHITLELDLVCGCDAVVYGNRSAAWAAGTSIRRRIKHPLPVRSAGECPRPGTLPTHR